MAGVDILATAFSGANAAYLAELYARWVDDPAGAVDDVRILFNVGRMVAQADQLPQWRAGNEFKARRDSMMSATASAK